jgi:hypothetical protein
MRDLSPIVKDSNIFGTEGAPGVLLKQLCALWAKSECWEVSGFLNALSKLPVHPTTRSKRHAICVVLEKACSLKVSQFEARDLAMAVNAFSKMRHESRALFKKVAKAATPMIRKGAFNAQDLANTVNAFSKMRHESRALFEEVDNAAVPMIKKWRIQRREHGQPSLGKRRSELHIR